MFRYATIAVFLLCSVVQPQVGNDTLDQMKKNNAELKKGNTEIDRLKKKADALSGNFSTLNDAMQKNVSRLSTLSDKLKIRNEIDNEFWMMSFALANMHDPKVSAVMDPYVERIAKLQEELHAGDAR